MWGGKNPPKNMYANFLFHNACPYNHKKVHISDFFSNYNEIYRLVKISSVPLNIFSRPLQIHSNELSPNF